MSRVGWGRGGQGGAKVMLHIMKRASAGELYVAQMILDWIKGSVGGA